MKTSAPFGIPSLPPLSLLDEPPEMQETVSVETLEFTSRLIEKKLSDFGVEAKVVAAYPGPVVTRPSRPEWQHGSVRNRMILPLRRVIQR